ncbi:hypothetical protein [Spongiactinospora sp. 9N601]|uniref:hypothetical protein n=1 Tax=Spongiactinospora sp. 9N601 TaxID=3375149 RepID=UPI0037ACAA13
MLAVAALATSCSAVGAKRQPTAAEAGATLKAHILRLLDEVSGQDVRITDPGGKDIPCGEGKVKRTFAASALDNTRQRDARTLNIQMVAAVNEFANYDITDPEGPDFSMASDGTKTSLHLNSSDDGRYSVRGQTSCLSPS